MFQEEGGWGGRFMYAHVSVAHRTDYYLQGFLLFNHKMIYGGKWRLSMPHYILNTIFFFFENFIELYYLENLLDYC